MTASTHVAPLPVDARLFDAAAAGDPLARDALTTIDQLQGALHENDVRDAEIFFVLWWYARGKVSGNEALKLIADIASVDLDEVTA
jgi:hypothetical protein